MHHNLARGLGLEVLLHISYSLILKWGYIGDYIGEYYRGY